MKFYERGNLEYLLPVVRAKESLKALAWVDENLGVRKQHLKAAQKWFGGTSINYVAFFRNAYAGLYEVTTSTSTDPIFNAQMERNLNAVAEKVRSEFSKIDNTVEEIGRPFFVQFDINNQDAALFKDNRLYLASWIPELKLSRGSLLINNVEFHTNTFNDMEMTTRGSVSDEMLAANRMVALQDMMQAVSLRPAAVSVRQVFRNWSAGGFVANTAALMWDDISRRWSYCSWYDGNDLNADGATADRTLFKELESMREYLRRAELASMMRYEADQNQQLPKLRQLALRVSLLSKDYAIWATGIDAVTGLGIDDAAITRPDADALEGGEGDDICIFNACSDGPDDVIDGRFSFSERIVEKIRDYIQRVDAAIAADLSLSAAEIKKLHGEISGILGVFQSHADGSRRLLEAEKMSMDMPDSRLEEGHKKLADVASTLASLRGCADDLAPEETHVAARNLKYWVLDKDIKISGQQVSVTMLRTKEQGKKSSYVVIGTHRPGLWSLPVL